jgi:subtilisin family serine protease
MSAKSLRPAYTRHVLLVSLLALLIAAVSSAGPTRETSATGGDTVTVIVELKDEPAARYAAQREREGAAVSDAQLEAYRSSLRAKQDAFLSALASRGVAASLATRAVKGPDGSVAATLGLRYTLVYNGLALDVPRSAVSALKAMPEVRSVSANETLYTTLKTSVPYINAPKVYGAVAELTQFDDLREGYEGQGINIAVLDTGIDWTHPMFGGDPTPPRLGVAPAAAAAQTNQKVIYNLPLTDIAANDGFGHGTHVASTAAGYLARHPGGDGLPNTADDVELHGVAPQAKLMSYTVCSNIRSIPGSLGLPSVGGCEAADIMMALEDSVSPFTVTGQPKPRAHVINLSLGGAGGPDSTTAVACSNAALTGATVVASSGNSGPGEGTTGSPAAGTHVISVGANTHPGGGTGWSAELLQASSIPQNQTGAVAPASQFPVQAGTSRIQLNPMSGTASLPAGSMAQRYVFINNPAVLWPASVSGRIALVKDALGATIFDIVAQAYNAGAVGVILFDDRGAVNGIRTLIPAATVSSADGEILVDALSPTDDNNVDPPNGAISALPVRMNPFFSDQFVGEMGDFSSRGPVRGLGQIKPDISAPGVAVLAAVPPASLLGALGAALEATPNYLHLDGTSMSAPHVAGAVALIKQARPNWSPDIIRTALINTATNMRNQSGAPKADGPATADSIIAQGGGLIDVSEALNARALMGVSGDGLNKPRILGSHSFGEVPVINSRVTHTEAVPVTVRDLSGEGGTYRLGVANNRDLQLAGINVAVSQLSVTVPPNGSATFEVSATVDGNRLREVMAQKTVGTQVLLERIQMQWFVTAERTDGRERLRMPFFFRPGQSLPQNATTIDQNFEGTVLVGDAGQQLEPGVTYVDVPFAVAPGTSRIEARLEWLTQEAQDMDFELRDPAGKVVANSGVLGGPEQLSLDSPRPGDYTYRVVGYANGPVPFTITGKLISGPTAPAALPVASEFTDSQGRAVDFDGSFTLAWQPTGGEQGYEVERSINGGQTWQLIAAPGAGAQSLSLADQPDGELRYRVRGLHPGRIGHFVTAGGTEQTVVVSRRTLADITAAVESSLSNISLSGGVFQFDLRMTNTSTETYLPHLTLKVVGINSASGTVKVANADNGGAGTATSPAAFDYSTRIGPEQEFAAGETSAARTLRFNDPRNELFTFDAQVTAYRRAAAVAGASTGGASSTGEGGSSAGDSSGSSGGPLLRFSINPLTKQVGVQLLRGLL